MNNIIEAGVPLSEAKKAAILLHGRGATAQSILSLKEYLNLEGFALVAPQADGNTWYPYSFMAPDQSNVKALQNSLSVVQEAFDLIIQNGIAASQVYFIGFSQGACLSLDFTARNAQKFGGIIAFTGGLIGEKLKEEVYSGDFQSTPIFIGSSERDFHVPAARIQESATLLKRMNAEVKVQLFDDGEHTIRQEEVEWVNKHIFR